MSIVYLGLGSNIGDRRDNILTALAALNRNGVKILRVARIIETEPVGGPPQAYFLNTVAKAATDLSVFDLLQLLKNLERAMGRRKTVKNGPRVIDVDILLYGNLKIKSPRLTIPHPEMFTRAFVLKPLLEIAPEIRRKFLYAYHIEHI